MEFDTKVYIDTPEHQILVQSNSCVQGQTLLVCMAAFEISQACTILLQFFQKNVSLRHSRYYISCLTGELRWRHGRQGDATTVAENSVLATFREGATH